MSLPPQFTGEFHNYGREEGFPPDLPKNLSLLGMGEDCASGFPFRDALVPLCPRNMETFSKAAGRAHTGEEGTHVPVQSTGG